MTRRSSARTTMARAYGVKVGVAMLGRLRTLDPWRADLLLAGAFLIEALGELALLVPSDAPHHAAAAGLIALAAFTLAVRRRWTVVAVLLGVPVQILANMLGREYVDHMVTPFFAILLVLYTL